MVDPGFPIGGRGPHFHPLVQLSIIFVDARGSYISKILYVEKKESGPLGEGCAPGIPPRSANANVDPILVTR